MKKNQILTIIALIICVQNTKQMFLNKTSLFQAITEINLNGFKIDYIDSNTFDDLSNIKKLYLQNNLISHIDSNLFQDLKSLEELWLESNNIISFDKNALIGLTNLQKVCIFNNPISKYFPERLKDICRSNLNCIVKIQESCDSPTVATSLATSTLTTSIASTQITVPAHDIKGLLNFKLSVKLIKIINF